MNPGLDIEHLSLRYGQGAPVLSEISFRVAMGQVTLLCGPNGSGKSSLLKAIAGLMTYRGEVRVQGQNLATLSHRGRAQLLAYVPQRSELWANVSVREVVGMGRFAHEESRFEKNKAVDRALERLGCQALASRGYPTLSGGQQQQVLLARALATNAKVLLLDEPTAALDIQHTLELISQLREFAQSGLTVLWAMHDLHLAQRCADHCILLADAKIVAQGPPEQVLDAATIKAVYNVHRVEKRGPSFYLEEPECSP